jgi:hypothetical protein
LNFQAFPTLAASISVILQALENCLVEWPTQLALYRISVGINNQWNVGVAVAEVIEKVFELGIHDNRVRFGMVEDISDVVRFEPIVYRYA